MAATAAVCIARCNHNLEHDQQGALHVVPNGTVQAISCSSISRQLLVSTTLCSCWDKGQVWHQAVTTTTRLYFAAACRAEHLDSVAVQHAAALAPVIAGLQEEITVLRRELDQQRLQAAVAEQEMEGLTSRINEVCIRQFSFKPCSRQLQAVDVSAVSRPPGACKS